ncbi:MAG: SHOCT domain-containing protein [Clostridium sp.]
MFCGGFGTYGVSSGIGSSWMILAMGIRALIFIGLIFLAFKVYKQYIRKSNSAIKILEEKFVNGEINEEEYIKRKNVLLQKS